MSIKEGIELGRTRGDGMEQEAIVSQDAIVHNHRKTSTSSVSSFKNDLIKPFVHQRTSSIPGENLIYKPKTLESTSTLPAVIPQGKIFNLIPHIVTNNKPRSLNKKEPKFVPFEPYKAAVTPMIPYKQSKNKKNRNNLDLNILVTQMSQMKATELLNLNSKLSHSAIPNDELEKYKNEIFDLKKERDYYCNELKFQSQVNSELKKLLVAAVGEDIQTKVNVLTEDKLQLARALLDSAHNLSSHTEQIEFLAGQSEVWRSKFLASSLMVEELARWKASLTQKNNVLFTSNKNLLETCSHVREMQIEILKNLTFVTKMRTINLPSSNILDLSSESLNLSQHLVLHSGIGMPDGLDLTGLDGLTAAEKLAIEALQDTYRPPLMPMDEAFKAIFGKAFPSFPTFRNDDNSNHGESEVEIDDTNTK